MRDVVDGDKSVAFSLRIQKASAGVYIYACTQCYSDTPAAGSPPSLASSSPSDRWGLAEKRSKLARIQV